MICLASSTTAFGFVCSIFVALEGSALVCLRGLITVAGLLFFVLGISPEQNLEGGIESYMIEASGRFVESMG